MGFNLFYSKGTSLITYLIEGGYEKELCNALKDDLRDNNAISFLDIGSNIGLISLFVLSKMPDIKIYAFEPGPHQFELFSKTIKENELNGIILYNKALGKKNGIAKFAIHDSKDVSGDGFYDTGRAGKAIIIDVPVVTIDSWWRENKCPTIKVVKMDTEGSELWILQGAKAFLGKCKPNIYIEIWPDNLSAYPYDAYDILKWLHNNGYNLYTLTGECVTSKNLSKYLGVIATFIAKTKRLS